MPQRSAVISCSERGAPAFAELRARVQFLDKTPWGNAFVDALRLAGLPE
jgi:hypothetical protein